MELAELNAGVRVQESHVAKLGHRGEPTAVTPNETWKPWKTQFLQVEHAGEQCLAVLAALCKPATSTLPPNPHAAAPRSPACGQPHPARRWCRDAPRLLMKWLVPGGCLSAWVILCGADMRGMRKTVSQCVALARALSTKQPTKPRSGSSA